MAALKSKLKSLAAFSACDVSDALLKLKVPRAGFLAELLPYAPHAPHAEGLNFQPKIIAPASTVVFAPKNFSSAASTSSSPSFSSSAAEATTNTPGKDEEEAGQGQGTTATWPRESNIPKQEHYVDLTEPDTVVVMSQPAAAGQYCAVLGGIMALRMKKRGALGVVLDGRIRDLTELRSLKLPVWAAATSTVGTAAEAKPWAINVPVTVKGVAVKPGDIVFCDPIEGVVVIPQDMLDAVLDWLPKLTDAEDGIKKDVSEGKGVRESIAKWRSNL